MKRAKIVATFGPSLSGYERTREAIEAGVNIARLNLSHGSHDVHEAVYADIRRASDDLGTPVAVLVDLQGPKIRLGKIAAGPQDLAEGDILTITTEDVPGDKHIVSTTFKGLAKDVSAGDSLLIDDGRVMLRALESDGVRVRAEVVVPGRISDNKGINLPGVPVDVPALSAKEDRKSVV